jgi:pimeloyl-ACP methyl ester carboxylesterase
MGHILDPQRWPTMPLAFCAVRQAGRKWEKAGRSYLTQRNKPRPQGVHAFLRAYYHYKSADWKQNKPFRLASLTAEELAKMPTYYIMDFDKGMAETVASVMPTAEEIAACKWLPDNELAVYTAEYERTGFQGGLQGYRRTGPRFIADLQTFGGRTIDVPSLFIGGKSDWGVFQNPGSFEAMQNTACTQMRGVHLIDGAGHWLEQEQPGQVSKLLIQFLQDASTPDRKL